MSYTQIPSNPFTVPGSAAGFLDIRKRGTTGPVITVAVPSYAGGSGGGTPGVALDFAPAAADYFNNAKNKAVAGSTLRNAYARIKINAAGAGAGTVTAFGYNFPVQVDIQKNGAYYTSLNSTTQNQAVTLPFNLDGPGVYTFLQSQQTSPGDTGDIAFSNIDQIHFDAAVGAAKIPVTRAKKLVIMRGDSVNVAGFSSFGIRYGTGVIVQPLLTDTDVLTLSYGGKRGYSDMQNSTTQAALLAQVATICQTYTSVEWYDCCGINDAQSGSIPPATWAQAIRDGLVYLHANIPNLTKVYWASPTPVADLNSTGPSGAKFSEFQNAVQPAVSALAASWMQYVDGNALGVNGSQGSGPGQTMDGTHPNDQTYILLGQRVADVLNGTASPVLYQFTPDSGVTADARTWASSRGNLVFMQADSAKRASFSAAGALVTGGQSYLSNTPSFAGLTSLSFMAKVRGWGSSSNNVEYICDMPADVNGIFRLYYVKSAGLIYLHLCTANGGDSGTGAGKALRAVSFGGGDANVYFNITPGSQDPLSLVVNGVGGYPLGSGTPNTFANQPITLFNSVASDSGLGATVAKFAFFNRVIVGSDRDAFFA